MIILACAVFIVAAFLVGWGLGGLTFPTTPLERRIDFVVVGAFAALVAALYYLVLMQ